MSQPPRIHDAATRALVELSKPRTTTYGRTRAQVPREELYIDRPGTPHRDHVPVTPELGERLIRGLRTLPNMPVVNRE